MTRGEKKVKERNGKRRSREQSPKRMPDLGYYFIATDTKETEENYINGLKDSLPESLRGRIVVKVFKTKTHKLIEKCLEAAALEPQYGEPWIVFDRDEVENFDDIIQRAERKGVNVGWSNPCIEIWFHAYFGNMHSYADGASCCRDFADFFYRKTGKEYKKSDPQIYELLNRYGDEEKAIQIAEQRLNGHAAAGVTKPSAMNPGTTLHRLVGEIRRKGTTEG